MWHTSLRTIRQMDAPLPTADDQRRRWWLGAVGVRVLLSLAALPLTPLLLRDGLATLLVLRPAREFLVLGGYRVRADQMELLVVVLAVLPMLLLGNWVFFGLGRAYRDDLDHELPDWLRRSVDPRQVARLRRVLARRGTLLVVLARLAIFPVTLLAAASGASPLRTRRFLLADTLGATLSIALYVGIGHALGSAYDSAGLWIALLGVTGLVAILLVLGRALRATDEETAPRTGPEADGDDGLGWSPRPNPDTSSA